MIAFIMEGWYRDETHLNSSYIRFPSSGPNSEVRFRIFSVSPRQIGFATNHSQSRYCMNHPVRNTLLPRSLWKNTMKKEDEKISYKEGGNIFRSEVLCGLYQLPSFGTIAWLRNTIVMMLSLGETKWRAHRTFLCTSEQLPAEPVFQTKRFLIF